MMKQKRKTIEFINAVCASRTKKLVSSERLRRMAEAESLQVAFDILRESAFGGEATYSYRDYEKLIESEENLLCEFVKEYAPSDEIENYCLVPNDFYNAEVMLKSKLSNLDYNNYVQSLGIFSLKQLEDLVEGSNDKVYPKELVKAVQEGKVAFEKGGGGMAIGAIFAREKYAYLKRIVKTGYLKDLLVKKIDCVNLCVALRAGSEELAFAQFIGGGSLTEDQLKALISLDLNKIKAQFENHHLKEVALQSVNAISKGQPLVETERFIASIEAERLIAGRYTEQTGTYPFTLYYFKRKNEIACVRTLLTGKANGLDAEQIKRRLVTV